MGQKSVDHVKCFESRLNAGVNSTTLVPVRK